MGVVTIEAVCAYTNKSVLGLGVVLFRLQLPSHITYYVTAADT